MPRPKRNALATIQDAITPPDTLPATHVIARITKAEGKNLYSADLPSGRSILAELETKLRSTVWIRRGSYVVVDASVLADRENKLDGEIVNVVGDEKTWRKMAYWPREFAKKLTCIEDSDEEESTVGKLPPVDSDED